MSTSLRGNARTNLNNIGGTIEARSSAVLKAGRRGRCRQGHTTRPSAFPHNADPTTFRANAAEVFDAMKRGAVHATIGARFPLARVADAHRAAEGRATTGAIVLLPQSRPNSTTTGWWSDTCVCRSTAMRRTCGASPSLTKTKSQATGSGP